MYTEFNIFKAKKQEPSIFVSFKILKIFRFTKGNICEGVVVITVCSTDDEGPNLLVLLFFTLLSFCFGH